MGEPSSTTLARADEETGQSCLDVDNHHAMYCKGSSPARIVKEERTVVCGAMAERTAMEGPRAVLSG